MNNELILLIKKHTDTFIEHPKSRLHEAFEFKIKEQMETFSFSPPINIVEEKKALLEATSFEATGSDFNISDESNSFRIGTPGYRRIPNFSTDGITDEPKELMQLPSQNGCQFYVKEVEKRGTQIEIGNSGYNLAGFDPFKNEVLAEL